MNSNTSMFLFTVGLLMTLGGVGGIEHSVSNMDLLLGVLISGVGLLTMWVGTMGLNRNQNG